MRVSSASDSCDTEITPGRLASASRASTLPEKETRTIGDPAIRLGDDAAAVDDQDAVADRVDFRKDVRREEDGPLFPETPDRLPDPDDLHRVESDGRLVQDQHRRPVDEGAGERGPLTETLRQVVDLAVRHLLEEAALDRLGDPPLHLGARDALQPRAVGEVLVDPHLGIEGRGLREISDPGARGERLRDDVESRHARGARGGREESRQDAHGRRLPGPVGSEKTDDLALLNRKGNVGDRELGRKALGEILDFDHPADEKRAQSSTYSRVRKPGAGSREHALA
jgi:hypothetical protein